MGDQSQRHPDPIGGATIRETLSKAGRVGGDLLAVDWSATLVGAPERWPSSLTTAVRILISSRFSMWMAWGPELTFFCNDAYRRDTLGKKYPWALGRPASQVWEEIWPDIGPRIESVLSTGQATWDESLLLFLERNGYPEETYHTFSYSPLADDDGRIAGMLCVVSEDTERVIGERRIATLRDLGSETTTGRDDRQYLHAAARHLEAGRRSLPFTLVYLFDGETRNAELACASGIEPGHPAAPARIAEGGRGPWPVTELAAGRSAVIDGIDRQFERLPTGGWQQPPATAVVLPLHHTLAGVRPYGFLVVGANRYRPLDEAYHSFLRLVAAQLAAGIASTRAYEAERKRAEELAELDRAKTTFFTNISHELRTPLTLLLGPAEDALAEPALPAAERKRIQMIARNGQRLLGLVNTLLDFSRLESGRVTPRFEPVELGHYTAELASMFESMIERAGLGFKVECPALPEPVYVDREMWAKIVLNLLSNALKFTLQGSIAIRLEEGGGFARLAVTDTGIGIEPREQTRLFERFHRVAGARGRTHEGSGIGLALVSELAHLHGGRVGVQSEPGRGSTFTITLPLGCAHLPPEQIVDEPIELSIERQAAGFLAEADRWIAPSAAADGDGRTAGASAPGLPRILVVDDNVDMREYVTSILAERYSVQAAPDGQAALELARAEPPDLVLTDVMMPRLDGFGLLECLRADPATVTVPVVMLSARAGEEGVIEGLEAGADDYLVKPFSARELRARVRANLELDRVRRTRDQLERSRRLQDQAERLAEVGSWEVNIETGARTGSEQLLQMLRLDRAEFESLSAADALDRFIDPAHQRLVRDSLASALGQPGPFAFEVRLNVDGDARWAQVRGEVLCDEQGKPTTLRGFVQDTTLRREAEQARAAEAAAREAAAREHQLADELQRSLLPPITFESVQLEVAACYQPGVRGTRVGGDWYDVIDLGAGRTALVIGDVAGRGVRAAGLMGQIRAAARAGARLDLPPADVLELLDAAVSELTVTQLVTCVYGVYDPAAGEFRYANAGHLPPLLAPAGQAAQRLPDASDPPLGLGSSQYSEHCVPVEPGAVVILYTDGLVERREQDLDDRIDELARHLGHVSVPIEQVPADLLGAFARDGSEDDIAILVARAGVGSDQHAAQLDVPSSPSAVQDGRRFTTATLREWSLPDDAVEDASLIASELLTNAIVHGQPPVRLRLRRTPGEIVIEVQDGAAAMPRKLRARPDDLHGRGLAIVADLATRWAARPEPHGKTVWSALATGEP